LEKGRRGKIKKQQNWRMIKEKKKGGGGRKGSSRGLACLFGGEADPMGRERENDGDCDRGKTKSRRGGGRGNQAIEDEGAN